MSTKRIRWSARQSAVLAALRSGGDWGCAELASVLGTSEHGAAKTASSLVHHGMLARVRHRGRVVYRLAEPVQLSIIDKRVAG